VTTPYERHGDQLYCRVHDQHYELTDSCPGCDADPSAAALDPHDAEPLPEPPEGCKSTLALERELVVETENIKQAAIKIGASGESHMTSSAAARHWSNYLNAFRQLTALAQRREDAAIVAERERKDAERNAGTSH